MANKSPLNRKKTIKEGTLEHQEKKNMISKNKGNYNRHTFSWVFFCFMVEAKIIILCNIVLSKCRGNI